MPVIDYRSIPAAVIAYPVVVTMGAQQSAETLPPSISVDVGEGNTSNLNQSDPIAMTGGFKISGAIVDNNKNSLTSHEDAYNKGKEDGLQTLHQSLSFAASQVVSNLESMFRQSF